MTRALGEGWARGERGVSEQATPPETRARAPLADSAALEDAVEERLLGELPHLTRVEVSERAGVPLDVAEDLWHLLGFPHYGDDDPAFTAADVTALRQAHDLLAAGVLTDDSRAALVRTWGRSFARLAEWQTDLMLDLTAGLSDPEQEAAGLIDFVVPRIDDLQSYIWRRHLAASASRQLAVERPDEAGVSMVVGFVDIVGYTATSKSLSEADLVAWLEGFERTATDLVVEAGGQVIKNIGDEVLFVIDSPRAPSAAADLALELVRRGADDDEDFPKVRVGLAYGDVVRRLGDVFGPTVNIAARLTSVARPNTVIVDHGLRTALEGDDDEWRLRRVRRVSVKGYSRLEASVLRGRREPEPEPEPDTDTDTDTD